MFNRFVTWRLNIVECVAKVKFLPFVSAHLMKGQNIDSFYVSQAGGEFRNLRDFVIVIRKSGDQDKP
jgi:hypothetical protein